MAPEINNYITKRYERWLDHAKYHCKKNDMEGEEFDVMGTVMLDVLNKDENYLLSMLHKEKIVKGQKLTELDFFILRAIKTNITSDTAPYRHKNKPIPRAKVEISRLRIPDVETDEFDHAGYILNRMQKLREIIDELGFSDRAMAIIEFRIINNESWNDWQGDEKKRELYNIHARIWDIIEDKIHGRLLI